MDEDSRDSTINEEYNFPQIEVKQHSSEMTIPSEYILSFDKLLTEMGFGYYQLKVYFTAVAMGIMEGAQVTIFTLMVPIIEEEWGIPIELVSLQTSFVFIGFLFGSLISGQITDRYGRKFAFNMSSLLTVSVCLLTIFCNNIYQLLMMRGLMGLSVGFFAPCCITALQEITPTSLRASLTSVVTLSVSLGQMYGLFLASLILDDNTKGNWRVLTFWGCFPGLIAVIMSFCIIQESPRFELLQGRFNQGYMIIQKMQRSLLSDDQKFKLKNWAHQINRINKNNKNASFSCLFQDKLAYITPILWIIWLCICFVYYGNLTLMPAILNELNQGQSELRQLVFSSISDVVGAIIASLIIDIEGLGRKNSLTLGFILASVCSYFIINDSFSTWSIIQRLLLSMNFIFIYQLTTEIYPTILRATGLGLGIAVGRIGGFIMPWACLIMQKNFSILSPFTLFGIFCSITAVITQFLPYDKIGQELDT